MHCRLVGSAEVDDSLFEGSLSRATPLVALGLSSKVGPLDRLRAARTGGMPAARRRRAVGGLARVSEEKTCEDATSFGELWEGRRAFLLPDGLARER